MSIKETLLKINPGSRASSLQGKPSSEVGLNPEFALANKTNFYYRVKPFYPLLLIVVLAPIFFGLGRLSKQPAPENGIKIEYAESQDYGNVLAGALGTTTPEKSMPYEDGPVIGSKSGKKYYFPWCGTVKRIKPENQVPFPSIEAARAAGFTPGGNCKGLK